MNIDGMEQKLKDYGADIIGISERFFGDMTFYRSCLDEFAGDENFAIISEAILQENYKKAFEAAHTLKGVSANMGLVPLHKAVCELVEALRAHEYGNLTAQYGRVAQEYERVQSLTE